MVRKDKRYLWHPFTQMLDWERDPKTLVIEEGEGVTLRDTDGNRYLDGISSLWVNVHGHRKKEIDEAIRKQLGKLAHSTLLGLANEPSILLAEKLIEIAPRGLKKVFYSDSGSTAVEIALKMALQYWRQSDGAAGRRKTKFVHLTEAYHGDTLGSVSIGGIDLFHKIYSPLLFDAIPVSWERPGALKKILNQKSSQIAAVILEPIIQGASGMRLAPRGFLREVRALCDRHGVLLIADEVATGFGRTGEMFACQHEGVTPDLMALAKGLTGGYLPLAATLTTQQVYDAFKGDYAKMKTFFHGHTYTGNPLACAAALANLELFKKEKTLKKLQPKIGFLRRELRRFEDLDSVGEVRQAGFMVGIELVRDKKKKVPYRWEEKIGIRVCQEARRRGAILRPLGNVIVLMPPLAIFQAELQRLLNITYHSIGTVCQEKNGGAE